MKRYPFLLAPMIVLLAGYALWLPADEDEHERKGRAQVATVQNAFYREECGSCHFAYQPGFLPAESWTKMMQGLEDHFGENAELMPEDQQRLTQYLVAHAANTSKYAFSVDTMRALKGKTPLRISEVPYIAHEHDEVPQKMVRDNPEVKSFSYCNKCHTDADKGGYDEHNIEIPGYGRWDD